MKPVEVHETGCREPWIVGQLDPTSGKLAHKGVWAQQMMTETGFARLTKVMYFDSPGGEDWRFGTSPESLAGFTTAYREVG